MIKTELLEDGRIHTYSSDHHKILQTDTGNVYDDAVDSVTHEYVEIDEYVNQDSEAEEISTEYQNGYDQAILDLIEQGVL